MVGCNQEGDTLPRQPIWGAVTLEGKPLAKGTIQFQPATSEPVSAGALINDGGYSIDRAVGSSRVLIKSSSTRQQRQSRLAQGSPGGEPPGPEGADPKQVQRSNDAEDRGEERRGEIVRFRPEAVRWSVRPRGRVGIEEMIRSGFLADLEEDSSTMHRPR